MAQIFLNLSQLAKGAAESLRLFLMAGLDWLLNLGHRLRGRLEGPDLLQRWRSDEPRPADDRPVSDRYARLNGVRE